METVHSILGAILGCRRLIRITVALGSLFVFGFAQNAFAQTPIPLALSNNYMITGDYVVGGVGLRKIAGPLQCGGHSILALRHGRQARDLPDVGDNAGEH